MLTYIKAVKVTKLCMDKLYVASILRDHPLFSAFRKSTESKLGEGINPIVHLKMLVIATVSVHEISLANQQFYSTLLGRREGVCKKSTLYTFTSFAEIEKCLNDFHEENNHPLWVPNSHTAQN